MKKFGNARKKAPPAVQKSLRHEMLPSREALAQLTHGSPEQRSLGNYAKLTPSGASALSSYQDIIDMGQPGVKVRPI